MICYILMCFEFSILFIVEKWIFSANINIEFYLWFQSLRLKHTDCILGKWATLIICNVKDGLIKSMMLIVKCRFRNFIIRSKRNFLLKTKFRARIAKLSSIFIIIYLYYTEHSTRYTYQHKSCNCTILK